MVQMKVRQIKPGAKVSRVPDHTREAQRAVEAFDQQYGELRRMRKEFSETFPEASEALAEIKSQEDAVADALNQAKIKVAQAKVTIGDFLCKRAFSQPGYDDALLSDILLNHPDKAALFARLVDNGVILGVKTDRASAAVFAAQNPKYGKPLSPAWKDKEELTPRVTTPKVL